MTSTAFQVFACRCSALEYLGYCGARNYLPVLVGCRAARVASGWALYSSRIERRAVFGTQGAASYGEHDTESDVSRLACHDALKYGSKWHLREPICHEVAVAPIGPTTNTYVYWLCRNIGNTVVHLTE